VRFGVTEARVIDRAADAAQRMRATPRLPAVTITWKIGAPGGANAAGNGDGTAPADEAVLEWRINGQHASATLRRGRTGADPEPVIRARVTRVVRDASAGLDHIEVDGLLWVTLAGSAGGRPRLLFARTTLLSRLGVGGGQSAAPRLA